MKSKVVLIALMLCIARVSFACVQTQAEANANLNSYNNEVSVAKENDAQEQKVQTDYNANKAILDSIANGSPNMYPPASQQDPFAINQNFLKGTSYYVNLPDGYDPSTGNAPNISDYEGVITSNFTQYESEIQNNMTAETASMNTYFLNHLDLQTTLGQITQPDTTICPSTPTPVIVPVVVQGVVSAPVIKETAKPIIKKIAKTAVVTPAQSTTIATPQPVIVPTPVIVPVVQPKHNWFVNILLKVKSWF